MSRSRRLSAGTALPAAALAAALVLTPTTAFAADVDPATTDATGTPVTQVDATATDGTTTPAPTEGSTTPADTTSTEAAPAPTATTEVDATSASGTDTDTDTDTGQAVVESAAPTADAAPVESITPTETTSTVDVGDETVDESFVFTDDFAIHPGSVLPVFGEGFTPGDRVSAVVTGDDVPVENDFARLPKDLVVDPDGATFFFVQLPEDFPVGGVVTVSVSDESGHTASTDLEVTTFAPAPHLETPSGATAGVVTLTGENAIPGGFAFVEIYDADDLSVGDEPTDGEPADGEPVDETPTDEPRSLSRSAVAADAADEVEPIVVDVEPVPYETSGYAGAVVPVDAQGRFSARFVLPAGDFVADAITIDAQQTTMSDYSDLVSFSVAASVTAVVPVATTPGTVAPAALPTRPVATTRATSLAYTGSEPSTGLGWALALVVAGAGALTAGRLRLRRR